MVKLTIHFHFWGDLNLSRWIDAYYSIYW